MAEYATKTVATAPMKEIGYAQAPQYNWWLYEDETTPELIWPQSVAVYDTMRRTDSQVTSVIRAMTLPVRSTPWRIDPNGARDEVVEFVAQDLGLPIIGTPNPPAQPRQRDRFSWPEHLRHALLMLPYGHMYFEQVYRVDEAGARAHLRKLAPRMPKTIERIDVASDGGLLSIKQWWTQTDTAPRPIPVDRLVAYIHEREGGNWLGRSILRPAYKNWLLKDRLLRVQAQTIERNGMGIPLYKGQEEASQADLAAGMAMAQAWRSGQAAGTAVPFGADLTLVGVSGTLPDADPVVRYHDEQIGRAVLAHFLNLGTQTGSWALGTTFADFFTLSLQTLAQQIADTATCHIVEDLVDINFGPGEPAPKIVFDEIGSRQAATAQALAALFASGAVIPDENLEEMLRQQYGLPPRDPDTARTPPATAPGVGSDGVVDTPKSVAAAAYEPEAAEGFDPYDPDDVQDADDEAVEVLLQAMAEFSGRVEAGFNPGELRVPGGERGGEWSSGGALKDVLKLAGRMDLDGGETLVGSDKVQGGSGTVRIAVTERAGQRLLRLGVGNEAFGSRDDEAGPWTGRDHIAEENTRRAPLRAERDALEVLDNPTPGQQARFDELDGMDLAEVYASGHTARLDPATTARLHDTLADISKRAKAAEAELQVSWDAIPDGAKPPPPVDVAEGLIPAEWGDIHYEAYVDEPESGLQVFLWIVPPGETSEEVRDAEERANLNAAELRKLVRLLEKMTGTTVRASAFDPSKHMRNPKGSVGGGRFRSMVDRLTDALKAHHEGGGKGDPFAGFDRDQLRRAAAKRGITLKRGASREDISKALLDDLHGASADLPAVPDAGKAKRDAARARHAEIAKREQVANLLAEVDELIGKDAAPDVIRERLDHAEATGVDPSVVAPLRRAVESRTQLKAAVTRAGTKHGLTAHGRAGQTVKFDPAVHESFGDEPALGTPVQVVRRGTTLTLDGETIPLSKAQVTVVGAKRAAPRKTTPPRVDTAKALKPPAAASGNVTHPARGRNISKEIDYGSLPAAYNAQTDSNDALKHIIAQQGFDGPPAVASSAAFDAAKANGEVRETWRGIGTAGGLDPADLAEQYRTGDFHVGLGINGDGTYVALNRADGEYYGSTLLRIGLRRDAKVISADDLDREMDAFFAADRKKSDQLRALDRKLIADLGNAKTARARANIRRKYRNDVYGLDTDKSLAVQRDPGIFAALRGYDAIEIPKDRSPDKHHEMIILNRTATIVQES